MKKSKPKYGSLAVSLLITAAILAWGVLNVEGLNGALIGTKLLLPLGRLMCFILVGLIAGQIIESSGWTKYLAALAGPLFRFGNLGKQCSAAFTAAFVSGVAANAMLLGYYQDKLITRRQLYLSNFVNQLPAYFLHLPTTFFIVIPLTGKAGIIYFVLTFLATLLRTCLFLVYGFFRVTPVETAGNTATEGASGKKKKKYGLVEGIIRKIPARIVNIAVFVLPIYVLVFVINRMGMFKLANELFTRFFVVKFIPVEALSVVILSFAAEFTSGFAAAGALLDAGAITVKQTVLALILGNILAFPIRALRHQLPRYIGIFSPRMGTEILLMGQGFRITSLMFTALVYYVLF